MTKAEVEKILEHVGDKVNRAYDQASGQDLKRDIDEAWRNNRPGRLRYLGVITEQEERQLDAALDWVEGHPYRGANATREDPMARKRRFQTRAATADSPPEEIGHIGDVNWAEYGGGPVYCRREAGQTDIYGDCFLEYVEPPDEQDAEEPSARWTVYSVELDPEVPSWADLKKVGQTMDRDPKELAAAFVSTDPMERAGAYQDVAGYYGWENFDSYPSQLTCAEMNERYEADLDCYGAIQTELAEVVEHMVDQSSAQGWSHVTDQMADDLESEGFDPKSIVIVAEFGDAVAVNEDIETEKTFAGIGDELEAEGYEYIDKAGGRVPTTEGYAYGEHVIRAVAKKMKVPVERVEEAAKALDWWQEEIPGSSSGRTYVYAKRKTEGAEERRERRSHARRRR